MLQLEGGATIMEIRHFEMIILPDLLLPASEVKHLHCVPFWYLKCVPFSKTDKNNYFEKSSFKSHELTI